jgi:hypothetical protein
VDEKMDRQKIAGNFASLLLGINIDYKMME